MKISRLSIFYAIIISYLLGCGISDMERAVSKKIIGNIYVINLNIPEDSGFYIIYRKKPADDNYLLKDYEYVDYLEGNDSVLLLKTKIDSLNRFHIVEHIKGDTILGIKHLSSSEFFRYKHSINPKYYFNSNLP